MLPDVSNIASVMFFLDAVRSAIATSQIVMVHIKLPHASKAKVLLKAHDLGVHITTGQFDSAPQAFQLALIAFACLPRDRSEVQKAFKTVVTFSAIFPNNPADPLVLEQLNNFCGAVLTTLSRAQEFFCYFEDAEAELSSQFPALKSTFNVSKVFPRLHPLPRVLLLGKSFQQPHALALA